MRWEGIGEKVLIRKLEVVRRGRQNGFRVALKIFWRSTYGEENLGNLSRYQKDKEVFGLKGGESK